MFIETEAPSRASTELPNMSPDSESSRYTTEDPKQDLMPKKVIETEATTEASTELSNMSPDSNVIKTGAPKSDMITVDLKTQDTQLNPNPKQNPIPMKTRTPGYKFKENQEGW